MSETATATLPHPMTRSAPLDVEALWRHAADDLYAYACTVLRDPAGAEDVVAVTFERALRRQGRFDRRRGDARAWLFGIARNAAIDELRRRKRGATLTHAPRATARARSRRRGRGGGRRARRRPRARRPPGRVSARTAA